MAILDTHTNEGQPEPSPAEAAAQLFWLAFEALPVESQEAVLRRLRAAQPGEKRQVALLLDAIASERYKPPPGAPDSLQLLREDRMR